MKINTSNRGMITEPPSTTESIGKIDSALATLGLDAGVWSFILAKPVHTFRGDHSRILNLTIIGGSLQTARPFEIQVFKNLLHYFVLRTYFTFAREEADAA